ncbi:methyltransferase type 11 [Stenomitos frigidus ULC18]|uniref:Methyltransferase type 11 n=2 Tax=Stenomitos TaxID=1844270 RepID=A0A2T1EAB2_9CYAN|nr:methyltransferase type 11 [Stenomitos frigidus ULC18]
MLSLAAQSVLSDRRNLAAYYYIKGNGIEIGALHNPLTVSSKANVRYVDRMSVADLKTHYPELSELPLVKVDILDDGEDLTRIPSASQDFVIANHFIEHCQNPIKTIQSMLRVLKPEGILYLGIPDKRYNFDVHRPLTDIGHLLQDYNEGPEWSKKQHFLEWAKFPTLGYTCDSDGKNDPRIEAEANRFMEQDYSIHYHVWTQTEILELLVTLQKTLHLAFEVEFFLKNKDEMVLVLRKNP